MTYRRWGELSPRTRATIVALGAVELVLTAAAAVDLWRRSPGQVRAPKAAWWPAIRVQPVGPLAYLAAGRRASPRRAGQR